MLLFRKGDGHLLQFDCPDLAMERVRLFADEPLSVFQDAVALHVEAINQAVEGIPRERIRTASSRRAARSSSRAGSATAGSGCPWTGRRRWRLR